MKSAYRIAREVAGELEAPARVVRRTAPGRHLPQIEPAAHVVRAAVVGQHVRHLERRIELVPVGAGAADPLKLLMLMLGIPGLLYLTSPSKPGMPSDAPASVWPFTMNGFRVSKSMRW